MQEQAPNHLRERLATFTGDVPHLARRFFGFLRSRPPTPREQAEVSALLDEAAARLFWGQAPQDQRHGIDVMHVALRARPGDRVAARAALLHDVGKQHSDLGAVERSAATIGGALGLPLPLRWATYRDHAELGATDLESIAADPFVVAFTRHHPGPPPPGVDPERWAVVAAADHSAE